MRVDGTGLGLKSWLDVSIFLLTESSQLDDRERLGVIADRIQAAFGANFHNALNALTSQRLSEVADRAFLGHAAMSITLPPALDGKVYSAWEVEAISAEALRQVQIVQLKQKIVHAGPGRDVHDRIYGWLKDIIRLESEGKVGQENRVAVMQFSLLKSAVCREFHEIQSDATKATKRQRTFDPPTIPPFILNELDKGGYRDGVGVRDAVLKLIDRHAANEHLIDSIPAYTNG